MIYFVKYDLTTGAFAGTGSCVATDLVLQASEGIGVVECSGDPLIPSMVDGNFTLTFDPTPVRAFLTNKIDNQAGIVRSMFITNVAGQDLTYVWKTNEAKAWTADADQTLFPFLNAEATATGDSVSSVRNLVLTTAAQFVGIGAPIEGARMGAKKAVTDATNIKDMVAGATVNWAAIIGVPVIPGI
jgi:hypothetical protein